MKAMARDILISLLAGVVLPAMVLRFVISADYGIREEAQPPARNQWESKVRRTQKVRIQEENVEEMDLDTYLTGVVLAEMPAFFEPEALKAQAVVARTYACKADATGGKHGDGSVCTASACCQGYLTEEEYIQSGGTGEAVEKIKDAVYSTSGQVLTYDGEFIEAVYFSCSGGSTEDAVAVWGSDFPYLRSVSSPGEENAAHYRDTTSFLPEELNAKLGISLTGNPAKWVSTVTYTTGGGVAEIVIGGKAFSGVQLRSLLGLPSTALSVETTAQGLAITTRGYGHRVGMSQYGADAMAAAGSTYEEILAHYYLGTELIQAEQ